MSIKNQTFIDLEIILVDDGSTDSSGEICDKLAESDTRIKVIHKTNGGLSDARNYGIEQSTGDYIAFVDGDDWIDSTMYETMIQYMEESKAEIAICRYRCIYKDRTIDLSTHKVKEFTRDEVLLEYISENEKYAIQNAAWNKLYTRKLMGELRFPIGKYYEDIVYTTKLLSRIKKAIYIDQAFYNYIIDREGSIMNQGMNQRVITDQIPAYIEKTKFLQNIGEVRLAKIHEYYVIKRLLIFYKKIYDSKQKNRKEQLNMIDHIIHDKSKQMEQIYTEDFMNQNEKKKLELFLKFPKIFPLLMEINEKMVIPIKLFRNERKREGGKK